MIFEVSLFANKLDNVPKAASWSWAELCEKFQKPAVRAEKDGPLFSPAKFKGQRAKVNVQELSLLTFDLDHHANLDTIQRRLTALDCKYVVCSTHSHLRETESNPNAEPRYRVVIPLIEPIPAERFPALWLYAKHTTGLPIDEGAKDVSRIYYRPTIATPESPYEFYEHDGEALSWKRLLMPCTKRNDPDPITGLEIEKGIKKGRRNPELFKIAKILFAHALPLAIVRAALLGVNSKRCAPPLETKEIEQIARNAEKYPLDFSGTSPVRFSAGLKPLPVVRLSDVEAKKVNWLWEPMIPTGFFTLCDGVEGIGKTYLMLKVAAMTAAGDRFSGCSERTKQGEVLLLSAEDSASYILKPRLIKMGAPCDQIFALDGPFTLDSDGFRRLELLLSEHNFKLVLIDPLFSFTGKVNLNTDSEIRTVTDRLNQLAEKYGCAIVGIRHIGKTKGYGEPRNAGLNGVGWRAGARSHLIVGHDPDDKAKRAIAQTKTNLTAEISKSYGYMINESGEFHWTGESDLTVETMLSYKQSESIEERGAKKNAKDFLSDQLADGRVGSQSIFDAAKQAGISEATLKRAKHEMGIVSKKDAAFTGGWYWELPDGDENQETKGINEGYQITAIETLRISEETKPSYSNNLAEGDQCSKADTLGEILGTANGKGYIKCVCGKHAYVGQDCPFGGH